MHVRQKSGAAHLHTSIRTAESAHATFMKAQGCILLHARYKNSCDLTFKMVKIKPKQNHAHMRLVQRDWQTWQDGKQSFREHVTGHSPSPSLQKPVGDQTTDFFNILVHRQDPKLVGMKFQYLMTVYSQDHTTKHTDCTPSCSQAGLSQQSHVHCKVVFTALLVEAWKVPVMCLSHTGESTKWPKDVPVQW